MKTVESYLALDIVQLNNIFFYPAGKAKLTFSRGGEEIASISVAILNREQIVLRYIYNQSEQIADPIDVAYSRYNFGGERRWFICPGCKKRRGILYCARLFRCRVCLGLEYPSQRASSLERGMSRISKQRRKLGGSGSLADPFPPKKKRMRWATYLKLLENDQRDCEQYLSASVAALDRRLAAL